MSQAMRERDADVLRAALLSGRSVLVCEPGIGTDRTEPTLGRLARQVGREADHAFVVPGSLPDLRKEFARSMKAASDAGCDVEVLMARHGVGAPNLARPRWETRPVIAYDARPAFDPARDAHPLVTVSDEDGGMGFLARLVETRTAEALRSGEALPLVLFRFDPRYWSLFKAMGYHGNQVSRFYLAGTIEDRGRFKPGPGLAEAWAEATRARCGLRLTHDAHVLRIDGPGRTAFAMRIGPPVGDEGRGLDPMAVHGTLLATVDDDGYVEVARRYEVHPVGACRLAERLEAAWRRVENSGQGGPIESYSRHHDPLEFLLEHPFRAAPGLTALRRQLLDRIAGTGASLPALRVAAGHPKGRLIHLWIREAAAAQERRAARADFVATYPALAELGLDPGVSAAVDAGLSPIPALERATGAPAWLLRRLGGMPRLPGRNPNVSADESHRGLLYLEGLGHGLVPRHGDEAAWKTMRDLLDELESLCGYTGMSDARILAGFTLALPGQGLEGRLGWLMAKDEADRAGVNDFLLSLDAWIGGLFGADTAGAVSAERAVAGGFSPAGLFEASALWHRHPLLSGTAHGADVDATWPVPFAPVDLGDGWRAHVIDGTRGLVAEGMQGPDADGIEGLRHCVATYAGACAEGRSLVLSLRRREGDREVRDSTVELTPVKDGTWRLGHAAYGLIQHCGPGNARPSTQASRRLETLRRRLGDGRIPIDGKALERREVEWESEADARDLWPHWRLVLPRSLRLGDVDAFLARVRAGAR